MIIIKQKLNHHSGCKLKHERKRKTERHTQREREGYGDADDR